MTLIRLSTQAGRPGGVAAGPRTAMVDRLVGRLLHSPVAGVVDSARMLLTIRGRRTRRLISWPVHYAAGPDAVWVWPGHPERTTWWRDLLEPQEVTIRLRGRDISAVARVVDGAREPTEVERGLKAFVTRFPRRAAGVVGGTATTDRLRTAAGRTVLVRVDVDGPTLAATRRATMPPGRRPIAFIRRHPLAGYYALAICMSWALWIPLVRSGGEGSHAPGLAGPAVAGVLLTLVVDGGPGVRDLARRMARWAVAARWYGVAFAPLVAAAIGLALASAIGDGHRSWEQLSRFPGLPAAGWPAVFAMVLAVNGFGEEIGWRGVAWPRLRERHTLAGAALLLAVPWAMWHLPTFWLATGLADLPLPAVPGWLIGLGAGAVVLGWLYERAGCSMLIVALFHASLNMASATDGTAGLPAAMTTAAVIFAAVGILRRDRRQR